MENVNGKVVGTWDSTFSDKKITVKGEVGKGFENKQDALKASRDNVGAEVVLKGDDAKFHVYSVDDNAKADFTRGNIQKNKNSLVSNITNRDIEVKNITAIVTEDNYELVPSTKENYNFSSTNKVSPFIGKTPAEMKKIYNTNSTEGVTRKNPPESIKKALEPSIKLIELYDSKAADWLRNLGEEDYALAGKGIKAMFQEHEIYAAWTPISREGAKLNLSDMVLGDHFWESSDIEKASTLYHEYTHAVDNPAVRQYNKLYGTIDNLIHKNYGDKAEDKAYIAQWKMLNTLGVKEGIMYDEVKYYLEDRKIDTKKILE